MGGVRTVIIFLFLSLLGFPNPTASEPLCTDSSELFTLDALLGFNFYVHVCFTRTAFPISARALKFFLMWNLTGEITEMLSHDLTF